MKTIGMIGGVSTEATLIYYKTINALVRERRGGYHSADMRIHSVNFHDYNGAHETRDWPFIRNGFDRAAKGLESSGAEFWCWPATRSIRSRTPFKTRQSFHFYTLSTRAARSFKKTGVNNPVCSAPLIRWPNPISSTD